MFYIDFNDFKFYPWIRNPVVIGLHLSKELGLIHKPRCHHFGYLLPPPTVVFTFINKSYFIYHRNYGHLVNLPPPQLFTWFMNDPLGSGSNTFQVISCHGGQQFSEQYRLLKKLANFFALRTKKSSHTLILLCTVGITQPPPLLSALA